MSHYYRDLNGQPRIIDSYEHAGHLSFGCVEITKVEFDALSVPPLGVVQNAQIVTIEIAYEVAVSSLIAYMGTSFQADAASRVILNETLTALGGTTPVGLCWFDANNVKIPMTNAQLQGLAAALFTRGLPLFEQKQTRKAAIRAATTAAQVQAIAW